MFNREVSVAILGAGFAGLGMAIELQKAGLHSFTIFEAADEVGGTWRENTYPGCACDVPSHLYSFSFEPHPGWGRHYGEQGEILAYLKRCVERYRLAPHLRLRTRIVEAAFDEATSLWRLTTEHGEQVHAQVLIAGTGGLHVPAFPSLPGLERFRGPSFHSARWDHSVDLDGQRVAVIGTGASAIQFIPRLAPRVAQLHVFQRTPPWVLPKLDREFSPDDHARFARRPWLQHAFRTLLYWRMEASALGFTVEPRLMRLAARLGRRHIARAIPDPALRERVTPRYMPGCKRILISDDYYPALARPNVELVTDAITEVTERGVRTADGRERAVDTIVFGTGFDVSAFLSRMKVTGLGGRELNASWQQGAEAYYGMTVAGFPNLFLLVGPNTGLGHNSIVFMIEAQTRYVRQCIELLRQGRARRLEVRAPAQRAFNARLQDRLRRAVWQTGCQSWYMNQQGKNFTLWPGFTFEYWLRTRRPDLRDFELSG